jgi:hypothetical protein
MEEVKRLTPKPATLRGLYLLSGNVCAFPNCPIVMIDMNGTMIGEVCHIEAAEEGGPRFNSKMTNEGRRKQENLFLLCPTHHRAVDATPKTYTVAKLQSMKKAHEKKFKEIDQTLQQKFEAQIVDQTDALVPQYPGTLAGLIGASFSSLSGKQLSKDLKAFHHYIDYLRKVPNKERQFILSVLKRAEKLGNTRDRMYVNVEDINSALGVSQYAIKKYGAALERYSVGDLRDYAPDEWVIEIYDPGEYTGWSQIIDFANQKGIALERFVIDLQFQLLD